MKFYLKLFLLAIFVIISTLIFPSNTLADFSADESNVNPTANDFTRYYSFDYGNLTTLGTAGETIYFQNHGTNSSQFATTGGREGYGFFNDNINYVDKKFFSEGKYGEAIDIPNFKKIDLNYQWDGSSDVVFGFWMKLDESFMSAGDLTISIFGHDGAQAGNTFKVLINNRNWDDLAQDFPDPPRLSIDYDELDEPYTQSDYVTVPDGVFFNFMVEQDGDTFTFYINGNPIKSDTRDVQTDASDFYLAGVNGGATSRDFIEVDSFFVANQAFDEDFTIQDVLEQQTNFGSTNFQYSIDRENDVVSPISNNGQNVCITESDTLSFDVNMSPNRTFTDDGFLSLTGGNWGVTLASSSTQQFKTGDAYTWSGTYPIQPETADSFRYSFPLSVGSVLHVNGVKPKFTVSRSQPYCALTPILNRFEVDDETGKTFGEPDRSPPDLRFEQDNRNNINDSIRKQFN
jgi:hypothetical protein